MKKLILLFILSNTCLGAMNEQELHLYNLLNEYRNQNSLSSIETSDKLDQTAEAHTKDGNIHGYDSHSWSTCQFIISNASTYPCMWNKPQEIAGYNDTGYEISCVVDQRNLENIPEKCLSAWKNSISHNTVILQQGVWSRFQWKSIGVSIENHIIHVWFGATLDSRKAEIETQKEIFNSSFEGVWYDPNNQGMGVQLIEDEQLRISGVVYYFDSFGNPTWYTWVKGNQGDLLVFEKFGDLITPRVAGSFKLNLISSQNINLSFTIQDITEELNLIRFKL